MHSLQKNFTKHSLAALAEALNFYQDLSELQFNENCASPIDIRLEV